MLILVFLQLFISLKKENHSLIKFIIELEITINKTKMIGTEMKNDKI